jgi:hypothetical protein
VHPEVDEVLTLDGAIAALHFHHFGGKLKKTRENFKKRGKIKKKRNNCDHVRPPRRMAAL